MNQLFIDLNRGLGDAIICNGLIRAYAQNYDQVIVPAYTRNLASVRFMVSDLDNVLVAEEEKHGEAKWRISNIPALNIGYTGFGFDRWNFDESFYKQAGLDFKIRWTGFKFPKEIPDEYFGTWIGHPFVHEDLERGFVINRKKFSLAGEYLPGGRENIFSYLPVIEAAPEIHCINSCFLVLIDSLPEPDHPQQLFYHRYARNGEEPKLKRKWTIIE